MKARGLEDAQWVRRDWLRKPDTRILLVQVKAEKSADSEDMRGAVTTRFNSAPHSSSPQPARDPIEHPSQIFSPFQSQQQQQAPPHLQQPGMMELSGHSGPPPVLQHPDNLGELKLPL